MRFLGLFLSLIISVHVHSQFKEYKKLDALFNDEHFEKCIEQALKYYKKEPKELMPVLYCAKANYELHKTAGGKEKLNYIKQSLKYAGKITRIDKKSEAKKSYATFMDELHKASHDIGNALYYSENKDKSKVVFDYLAKIYLDTATQYYDFHPDERKGTINNVGVNTHAEKVNQIDKNGLKQGFWSKVYPNGVLAYEVYFKDNKPVGIHKRYHENGKLMAQLSFDDKSEWADAKLYNNRADLIAEGKYHKKLREGPWLYFKGDAKVAEENYVEGKRNGVSRTFYQNGKTSDERNWKKGVENGVWRQYFPSGKVKLETRIENGKRNAVYYTYYENGKFEIKGHYKNDQMDGDWIYYNHEGKEIQHIKYTMGKSDKQSELDEKENEILKKLEENKTRLLDPADFINNPSEYLKKNGLR